MSGQMDRRVTLVSGRALPMVGDEIADVRSMLRSEEGV